MDKPIRLLIADRNVDFTAILAGSISSDPRIKLLGLAKDKAEAYEKLKALKPDVLLLDIMLPYMDGIAVINQANRQPGASRPRILVLSRILNDGIICEAISHGVQCFIGKPCCIDFLRSRIHAGKPCKKSILPVITPASANLENRITYILDTIGIPAHIRGFHYMCKAIMIAAENGVTADSFAKIIYPRIAETFNTTPSRVERAIQHTVDVAWSRNTPETLHRFGRGIGRKPTNSEFIAQIVNQLWI